MVIEVMGSYELVGRSEEARLEGTDPDHPRGARPAGVPLGNPDPPRRAQRHDPSNRRSVDRSGFPTRCPCVRSYPVVDSRKG